MPSTAHAGGEAEGRRADELDRADAEMLPLLDQQAAILRRFFGGEA